VIFGYSLLSPDEGQEVYMGTWFWAAPGIDKGLWMCVSKANDTYSFGLVALFIYLGGYYPTGKFERDMIQDQKEDTD
jgi:hypothetical protein